MALQAPNPNELLKQLLTDAFPASRPLRSGAYIDGARAAMELLLLDSPLRCDYAGGSASFDAFQAGAVEGREIWARHMEAQLLTRRAQPANAADLLAAELLHAEKIILAMLPMLSAIQKDQLGSSLEAQGVIDDGHAGLTRYHERRAALTAAGFALPPASPAPSRACKPPAERSDHHAHHFQSVPNLPSLRRQHLLRHPARYSRLPQRILK